MSHPSHRGDSPSPFRARPGRRTRYPDLSPRPETPSEGGSDPRETALELARAAWEGTLPEADAESDPESWPGWTDLVAIVLDDTGSPYPSSVPWDRVELVPPQLIDPASSDFGPAHSRRGSLGERPDA